MAYSINAESPNSGNEVGSVVVDFLQILRRNRFSLFVLCFAAIGSVFLDHVFFPSYNASSTVYVKSANNNPLQAISSKLGGLSGQDFKDLPEKYLLHLKSYEFSLKAAEALKVSAEFQTLRKDSFYRRQSLAAWLIDVAFFRFWKVKREELSDEFIAEAVRYWVSYSPTNSDSLAINVVTPDPALTLLLSNVLAKAAVIALTDQDLFEINEAQLYLTDEITQTQKEIGRIESAIIDFNLNSQAPKGELGQLTSGTRNSDMKNELEEITVEIRQNEELLEGLRKKKNDIQEKSGVIDSEQSKFGLNYRIDELTRSNQYLQVRRSSIKKTLEEILKSQDPHGDQRVFDLRKRMETEYILFQELKRQIFQVQMLKISAKNRVYKMDDIRQSEIRRSTSLVKKIALSGILSFLLGLAIAYIKEIVTPRVRDKKNILELEIGFLGSIPSVRPHTISSEIALLFGKKIRQRLSLLQFDQDSSVINAFKAVRTRLFYMPERGKITPQVIAILSSEDGEGKSFFSTNLAACIGSARQRTLIIDCDIRKQGSSLFLGKMQETGLMSVLATPDTFGALVQRNIAPQVDFLPAGNPIYENADLLSGTKMIKLIDDLRTVYRYIILDTPSLNGRSESVLLAKRADLVIVVTQRDRTPMESLERTVEFLREVGQPTIYAVLNRSAVRESRPSILLHQNEPVNNRDSELRFS